jgi:hypothetical protein
MLIYSRAGSGQSQRFPDDAPVDPGVSNLITRFLGEQNVGTPPRYPLWMQPTSSEMRQPNGYSDSKRKEEEGMRRRRTPGQGHARTRPQQKWAGVQRRF